MMFLSMLGMFPIGCLVLAFHSIDMQTLLLMEITMETLRRVVRQLAFSHSNKQFFILIPYNHVKQGLRQKRSSLQDNLSPVFP